MISAASALSRSLLNSTIAPETAFPPAPVHDGAAPLRTMASRCPSFWAIFTTLCPQLAAQFARSGAKEDAANTFIVAPSPRPSSSFLMRTTGPGHCSGRTSTTTFGSSSSPARLGPPSLPVVASAICSSVGIHNTGWYCFQVR